LTSIGASPHTLVAVLRVYPNPEEMRRFYLYVLETGEQLGVPMPQLAAMRERFASRADAAAG